MAKLRVLCLTPFFLPSRQGGGSVTALVSMITHLRGDVDLVIVTGDRDLLSTQPYSPAQRDQARAEANVEIHYIPRGVAAIKPLRQLLSQHWDLVYLNSILSLTFCALPLLLLRVEAKRPPPLLIAPRGELMDGALGRRRSSKLAYVELLRRLGLLRNMRMQATSKLEAHALHALGFTTIELADDLPPLTHDLPALQSFASSPLRVVFLSRIEPKKNLLFALQTLQLVQQPVVFDIVGPIKESAYWAQCEATISQLPPNIETHYLGPVEPKDVLRTLAGYELFLLPTLAENNGYVIHEALMAGCSLLISDQTPWRDLVRIGVGEDLPLDPAQFAAALTRFAQLPVNQRLALRHQARAYGLQRQDAHEQVQATLRMFTKASGSSQ